MNEKPSRSVQQGVQESQQNHKKAGFLHGEINPDVTLMIGGRVTTVAELEMELDRLFRYVCELI